MMSRRRGTNLGVALLATQVLGFGIDKIPPATLVLIAGQTAIFLDMFPESFPALETVCLSPLVYHNNEWQRLILGALSHGSDMHLYYNMLSLLYKGSLLEKRFGTVYFAYLISIFTVLTGLVFIEIELLLGNNLSCAVGFSGVLFAIKVLTTHYSPSEFKHIYWVELILIQVLVPNASFVGHLAGILVGLAYIWGPLRFLMDVFLQPQGQSQRTFSAQGTSGYGYRSGAAPSAPPYDETVYNPDTNSWSYYNYTGGLNEDEQYQRAMQGSMSNSHQAPNSQGGLNEDEQYQRAMQESMSNSHQAPNSQGLYPDLDDLRSRRSHFYS